MHTIWGAISLFQWTSEQIREMAGILGVADPDAMLAAIHQRNAEDFTRRPLDLIELCADWREYQRIRTHREQLEHNIRTKLKPRADRPELTALSPEKALNGASRLALACLLSQKLTLRHSAESDEISAAESALDPSSILCDWDEKERRTLLERALFGIANYGRVRFHHRSVIEWLAAQQLSVLLNRGMATRTLKRLLFANLPQGLKVVKPRMRPIAAWLAQSSEAVFREVLDREPEILLDFGDPESLTHCQRLAALRAYVERFGPGSWRGMHVPIIQVHRFASRELASAIRELWEAGVENPEVRELLIEMIGAGKIGECADLALTVAMDDTAELRERREALEVLVQLHDAHIPDVVASMLTQQERWPEQLLKAGILSFFPDHLEINQLGSLLTRTSESPRTVGEFTWHWTKLIAECSATPEYLDSLREELTGLVMENAETAHAGWSYKSSRQHLIIALATVCLRQLLAGCRDTGVLKSSIAALRFATNDEYINDKETITGLKRELALLSDERRERLFWADVAFIQQFQPEVDLWNRFYRTWSCGPLQFDAERDNAWVIRKLADKAAQLHERMLMLEIAIHTHPSGQTGRTQYIDSLYQYVVDSPDLSEHLATYLRPVKRNPEHVRMEKSAHKAEEQRKRRSAKDRASWIALWREVSSNPDTAFGRDRMENTAWNLWRAATRDGDTEVAGWNRPFIEKHFSKEIADRLRLTLMALWRKDRPTLRSERPEGEKNTYLMSWQMGLAAIYAESEDPDWARKLEHEEALVAARYALIELNRFPAWLSSLAIAHPIAVEAVFGIELAEDLGEEAKPSSYYHILQYLRHEPPLVVSLFVPQLLHWFDSPPPSQGGEAEFKASERLQRVVDLLLGLDDENVTAKIERKAREQLAAGLDAPSASVWLRVLLRLTPAVGVQMLVNGLEGRETEQNCPGVMWISHLFGDRHEEKHFDLSTRTLPPKLLLELVRMAYTHVRPKDDISHEGSYSPSARDHAQRGRSFLLDAVLNLGGIEGWNIKQELANDPLFADFRDRALLLAREKAAQEADNQVFDIFDILDLYQANEAPPATRDELFELMLNRLDDLEDRLLQDDSPRELWAMISDERIMRRAIASALAEAANGIYSVGQEGVTADEKETDIRLCVAKHDLQGVIELKIGDKSFYSGRDLRDTLRDQLVRKYMAPENRRAGCLLVTVASERTWQHPETDARLNVNGLRSMLQDEADKIVAEMGWSLKLTARVLDLRARLTKEKAG